MPPTSSPSCDGDARLQACATAGWAVDAKVPVERLDTVGETVQARAAPGVRSADAVVGDADEDAPVVAQHADGDVGRVGVLGDVGDRLGDEVVGRGLDGLGQALV